MVDVAVLEAAAERCVGSSPIFRTKLCVYPRMVELVDTADLKSAGESRAGSTPAPGTKLVQYRRFKAFLLVK